MRAGPRPSRARRARGAAPLGRVAARDLLEVELLSGSAVAAAKANAAGDQVNASIFLSAKSILATRRLWLSSRR